MLRIPQCISHTPRVLKNGIKFAQNIPLNFANKYWSLNWSAAVVDAASFGLKESMSEKENEKKHVRKRREQERKHVKAFSAKEFGSQKLGRQHICRGMLAELFNWYRVFF